MKYLYTITGTTSFACEIVEDDYINMEEGKLLSTEPIEWSKKRFVNGALEDIPLPEPPPPYVPTEEEILRQKINMINYEYDGKFNNLKEAYLASQILNDSIVMSEISQEYSDLLSQYNSAIAQYDYVGGNDA